MNNTQNYTRQKRGSWRNKENDKKRKYIKTENIRGQRDANDKGKENEDKKNKEMKK